MASNEFRDPLSTSHTGPFQTCAYLIGSLGRKRQGLVARLPFLRKNLTARCEDPFPELGPGPAVLLLGTRPASLNTVQLFTDVLGRSYMQDEPGLGLGIAQRPDGYFLPPPSLSIPFHFGLWLLFAKLGNTRHSLTISASSFPHLQNKDVIRGGPFQGSLLYGFNPTEPSRHK